MNRIRDERVTDVKMLLSQFIKKWYYFLISLLITISLAFAYTKTSDKIYRVQSSVLLKDQSLGNNGANQESFISGLELIEGNSAIEDEIGILTSFPNIQEAIERLDFTVSYFRYQKNWRHFTTEEIYNSDFHIILSDSSLQILNTPVFITFPDSGKYRVVVKGEKINLYDPQAQQVLSDILPEIDIDRELSIHEPLQHGYLNFQLNLPENFSYDQNTGYYFKINSIHELTESYQEKLKIQPISTNANIVRLTTEGAVVGKEKDFLSTLAEVYIQNDLYKKNQLGINTVKFIDQQLNNISDSLRRAENTLASFRSSNRVIDISANSSNLLKRMEELENQEAELEVQLEYYQYMSANLIRSDSLTNIVAPSAAGINNPFLNSLLMQLSDLNRKLTGLDYVASRDMPSTRMLEREMQSIKSTIIDNIDNLISSTNIGLRETRRRIEETKMAINRLPGDERNLISLQRQFTLSDNIYNYLMQKRAEASIAVASSVPDKSVVEPPRMIGDMPVSPKTTLILITAVIFGLLLPFGIILMQDYFNNTISHKDEISQITDFPIIGTVVEGPSSTELVTQDYPGSAAAESFKFVKFNLNRDMLQQKRITVGVTSSLEGEGKTYCAANLSIEFARSGKRTLLIDFDLRRSRLHKIFRSKAKGITDYILSDHMLLSDIVQPTLINNLHIVSAGSTTAQDYSNLLDHPKSLDIIPKLVNDYEAIIVDTPPLTYVADYLIIQPLLDTTLLVIRHNYTDHRIVRSALDLLKSNNVNDVKVIFNGVKEDVSTYGYRYVNGKSKYLSAKRRVRYRQKA